jgi:membrane protein involved in colicin uptake
MSSFLAWWHRQSKKAQIAMGAATVLAFFVLAGALGSTGGEEGKAEANSAQPSARKQTSSKTQPQNPAALAARRAKARAAQAKVRAAKIAKAKARARKARAARRTAAAAKAAAAKAAAAKAATAKAAAAKAAAAEAAQASRCDPNYSGCLDPSASDYDCEGGSGNGPEYTGTVRVIGDDRHGLDADGDGYGCD